MKRIAIFSSGRGSNFSALVRAKKRGVFKAEVSLLVCDQPKAAVLAKARRAGVKAALVRREDFPDKAAFEKKIFQHLDDNKIDLVVMAGFMRMLSPEFVRRYKNKIINIHPALLPAFKGAHAIKDAFDYGAKATGVTVHFVDELMDHGPIILQQAIKIEENDTAASLEEKIHKIEHKLYPQAIKLFSEGRLKIVGRKVRVND